MYMLYFRYKNTEKILFRYFTTESEMYKFIDKEDIAVEQVKVLY